MARQTLEGFVKEMLMGEEKCTALLLMHYSGAKPTELKAFKVGTKDVVPREVAETFMRIAENHAEGLSGVQQYEVLAFLSGSKEPSGRYPFRKAGEQEFNIPGTEAPTATGITMQLMRHNEALARLTHQMSHGVFERMDAMIGSLAVSQAKFMQESLDALELVKEVITREADKSHQQQLEIMKAKEAENFRRYLYENAPALIAEVTGKKLLPVGKEAPMLERLAESLTEEQVHKLASVLTPEQWMPIASALGDILKNKREKEDGAKGGGDE